MTEPKCPDCQVGIGEQHSDGCDVARCLAYGGQRLMCSPGARPVVRLVAGLPDLDWEVDGHDCGRDVWSGMWPGEQECREFGWFAVGPPWVSCVAGMPGAVPDLNRLHRDAQWDPQAMRWRQRERT